MYLSRGASLIASRIHVHTPLALSSIRTRVSFPLSLSLYSFASHTYPIPVPIPRTFFALSLPAALTNLLFFRRIGTSSQRAIPLLCSCAIRHARRSLSRKNRCRRFYEFLSSRIPSFSICPGFLLRERSYMYA